MPTHDGSDTGIMTENKATLTTTLSSTISLQCGTCRTSLHQHETCYWDPYAERTRQYAIPKVWRRTTQQMTSGGLRHSRATSQTPTSRIQAPMKASRPLVGFSD
jgi:hypothetical protein